MNTRLLATLFFLASSAFLPAAETTSAPAPAQKDAKAKPVNMLGMFQKHWVDRVALFKKDNLAYAKTDPAVSGNVVMLGDSITEGFDVAKNFPGQRIINRGIGADIIGNALPPTDPRGILRRLDNSVFDCAPTDLFILIGTNDLGINHSTEIIEAGYREMLTDIRKKLPSLRIYVESVLPTRGQFNSRNKQICELNVRLKKIAADFSCTFVDLNSLMCDSEGSLKAEFTKDGLHLLDPGYAVWRDEGEAPVEMEVI